MIDTRLIFVDGIPGSGKTTLTNWLGDELKSRGRECVVYEELCDRHPLRIYEPLYSDFSSGGQSEEFRTRQIELFRNFIAGEAGGRTLSIFDSWLFQDVIGFTFLLRMDYSDSTDFAWEIFKTVSLLEPVVIYIAQTDVEASWRRICGIRGPEWTQGRCGIMNDSDYVKAGILWSVNQSYCLQILKKSGLRNLVIMNTDYGYDAQKGAVADFLQLEESK